MNRERTASDKPSWWSIHQILLALGERIRNERKQKGFSQEDFAAECGSAPHGDGTLGAR